MDQETLVALALAAGFSHAGELNVAALEFLPEVREMCKADKCRNYGRCWTCPPACGTLETIAARAAKYRRGILIQSTGVLEDDFDALTMLETERVHKVHFAAFMQKVRQVHPDCLPMSAGGCTICKRCTCPAAPCRHPDRAIPSMEAYGLLVLQVCEKSGLGYYYGPRTLTYTSCVLIDA